MTGTKRDAREEIKNSPEESSKKKTKKDRVQEAVDLIKREYDFDVLAFNRSRKYKLSRASEYLKEIYDIKLNADTMEIEFKRKGEKYYQVMDDVNYRFIQTDLDMQGIELSDNLYKNLLASGYFFERYTPMKDFIYNLPVWDGKTDHIHRWLQQVTLIDEERWRIYFVKGFKKWFTALVMSLIEDSISLRTINHTCLIFQGPQSAGKSTFIENLIPEHLRLQYLQIGNFNFHLKEDQKYLGSKILIDLAELSAMTRADNEAIKARITQQHFSARLPWGKADTRLKRRASFCGSTNDEQFLTDITGDRRFFCIPIRSIDIDDSLDVRLIYSQALGLYRNEFKYWFDRDDIKELGKMNEDFRVMSQEEEYIRLHFSIPTKEDYELNRVQYWMTSEISQWLCKKYERLNDNQSVKRNLGKALYKMGFHKNRKWINNISTPVWSVIIHDNPNYSDYDNETNEDRNKLLF